MTAVGRERPYEESYGRARGLARARYIVPLRVAAGQLKVAATFRAGRLRGDLRWWRALVHGGWWRRRSRRGGGWGRGRRFCDRRFRGGETSVWAECGGGPWRLRRSWRRLLLRRIRCGGRGRRGRGVRGLRGICPGGGFRCAGGRTVWRSGRRRSGRFASGGRELFGSGLRRRCGGLGLSSFRRRNGRGA